VHLVEAHHTAVLLVSHELGAVADDLDRVVVMKQRILFDGTPRELAATGVSLGVHADDLPRWLEELQAVSALPARSSARCRCPAVRP
jgi:energy-coupling factor transporter ATP-binding protein EcfA2